MHSKCSGSHPPRPLFFPRECKFVLLIPLRQVNISSHQLVGKHNNPNMLLYYTYMIIEHTDLSKNKAQNGSLAKSVVYNIGAPPLQRAYLILCSTVALNSCQNKCTVRFVITISSGALYIFFWLVLVGVTSVYAYDTDDGLYFKGKCRGGLVCVASHPPKSCIYD